MNLQQIPQQDIQWLLRYFTLNEKCQPLWTIKNLGVTMDRALTPDQHVKLLIHSCFFQMSNIAKLWPIVSQAAIEMLIHALISFCLDYCKSLFTGLSQSSLDHLQVIQNAAAKLLIRSFKRCHVTPILVALQFSLSSEYNLKVL